MARDATLQGLRNEIITSLFGRRAGFDRGDFLVGIPQHRLPIVALTTASTAADQIPPYGFATHACSSTSGTTYHSVQAPVPGSVVTVINISTGSFNFYLNGSSITTGVLGYTQPSGAASSGLTTATQVNLPKLGCYAILTGLSTALWLVEANFGTTTTTWGSSAT